MQLLLALLPTLSPTLPALQDGPTGWTGVLDEAAFAALHELREDRAPERRGESIELAGTRAYLSRPADEEPLGGIVVIHEWWGLNEHIEHWADRLASDGYVALAVDLYGGVVAKTREEAQAAMGKVDEAAALAILRAAHAHLGGELGLERTASIGWCFGGGWSLRLALAEPDLDAAVIYYGRLVTDVEALRALEADVLGVFGERDEGIPPSAVAEFRAAMSAAGAGLELRSYDAEHGFANPSSARYDERHAGAAWEETRAFLCARLWPRSSATGSFAGGTRKLEVTTVPQGWEEAAERPMRLASYDLGGGTECYVAAFPGEAGGIAANVNRWCSQLGASELGDEEIDALPRIPLLGRMATAVRATGKFQPMSGEPIPNAALLGAIVLLDGEAVFVKLVGPREDVEGQAAHFATFCRGLR